ncbi:unnamed protein product, partial [Citrullus colocynthis]
VAKSIGGLSIDVRLDTISALRFTGLGSLGYGLSGVEAKQPSGLRGASGGSNSVQRPVSSVGGRFGQSSGGGSSNASWALLFCSPSTMELAFTPLLVEGDRVVMVLSEEVLKRFIERIWEKVEMPTITLLENGLIILSEAKNPMELWTDRGLEVVASAVSKPIALDTASKKSYRLSYARVCMEVDGESELPTTMMVRIKGQDFVVPVSYE